jgi:hypothetical protein
MTEGSQSLKPEPGRVLEPKLTKVGSLSEVAAEGFSVFALGPVYVYGGVQDDLVAAFAAERDPGRPQDVYATVIRFDRPVLSACKEWSFILSAMDSENFEWFKKWMLGLQLVDRQRRTFWLTRHHMAPILDPFMLDAGKARMPSHLDLFSLSGMQGQIVPVHALEKYEHAPEIIRFFVRPPDPEVVKLGSIALEVISGS